MEVDTSRKESTGYLRGIDLREGVTDENDV